MLIFKYGIILLKFIQINIKYIFIPIITSFIVGFILYNIQIMFETTTKQVEYLEKVKEDIKLLFSEKYQLNDKRIQQSYLLLRDTRQIFYDTINNNEEDILVEYLKGIEKIYNKEYFNIKNFELEKEIQITFINERMYINILFLKIYSNNSLDDYEREIEKHFNLLDNLYFLLNKHLKESIYKLTDKNYIFRNLRTREDFKKHLETFNNNEIEKSLEKFKEDNEKISMELRKLEINLLNEINNRINGNFFEKLSYLFKSKVELYIKKP